MKKFYNLEARCSLGPRKLLSVTCSFFKFLFLSSVENELSMRQHVQDIVE